MQLTVDLLRTQVVDLLDYWTDRDGADHIGLLALLRRHLAPVRMVDTAQSVKAPVLSGPAPWDDAVAHLLGDVASGARTIERGLMLALSFAPRTRGGSDGNTRNAVRNLPALVDALDARGPEYAELVAEARVTVGAWHRAALLLLGAERRWAHLRSHDDDGNPLVAVCPWCESAVRIQPELADAGDPHRYAGHDCARSACTVAHSPMAAPVGSTLALCVSAACVDDDGMRRAWPVDPWLGQLLAWRLDRAAA